MDSDSSLETYDDQFRRYLLLLKGFFKHLRNLQDRKICFHWIHRVATLTPSSSAMRRNRNLFLQHFIGVMQEALTEEALKDFPDYNLNDFQSGYIEALKLVQDPAWLNKELNVPVIAGKCTAPAAPYYAYWADNQKTYIAAKALPGKGALVYMAVSTDPSLGWTNLEE